MSPAAWKQCAEHAVFWSSRRLARHCQDCKPTQSKTSVWIPSRMVALSMAELQFCKASGICSGPQALLSSLLFCGPLTGRLPLNSCKQSWADHVLFEQKMSQSRFPLQSMRWIIHLALSDQRPTHHFLPVLVLPPWIGLLLSSWMYSSLISELIQFQGQWKLVRAAPCKAAQPMGESVGTRAMGARLFHTAKNVFSALDWPSCKAALVTLLRLPPARQCLATTHCGMGPSAEKPCLGLTSCVQSCLPCIHVHAQEKLSKGRLFCS